MYLCLKIALNRFYNVLSLIVQMKVKRPQWYILCSTSILRTCYGKLNKSTTKILRGLLEFKKGITYTFYSRLSIKRASIVQPFRTSAR